MKAAAWVLLAAAILGGGCATVPKDPAALAEYKANNDPIEPFNRKMFALNLALDKAVIKPLAQGYRAAIPEKGRDAIRNMLVNLGEPLVFGNTILQARWRDAETTAKRFVINTTVGIVGINDFASRHGLHHQIGDFGQTLHAWGFGEGPYLVVPVVGPSNPRDLTGSIGDIYGDPIRYVAAANNYPASWSVGRFVVTGIDERAQNIDSLDALQRQSVDFYAALRSLVRQKRAAELQTGKPVQVPQPTNFYDDPGDTPAPPGAAMPISH